MSLISSLALLTLSIGIALAIWSKYRTERKLDDPNASQSSLARTTPDPALRPDPKVTNPHGIRH